MLKIFFGFLTSILLQNIEKIEKGIFWRHNKIFEERTKNENFEQAHSAKIFYRLFSLGFLNIHFVAKYQIK